ncbi:MAG: hypothetical protein ACRDQI_05275 [Pseudonocardiaceae bacterium]
MSRPSLLTPQSTDFPRWYQDVVARAELADNGPVRGTMVIRPTGYALWERMQREVDDVYGEFMTEVLAIPIVKGLKTARERFAGATNTLTCEAMMRDGKALQIGHQPRTRSELRPRLRRAVSRRVRSAGVCLANLLGRVYPDGRWARWGRDGAQADRPARQARERAARLDPCRDLDGRTTGLCPQPAAANRTRRDPR